MITKTSAIILNTKMPSLIRPLARQKLLFIPILVISFFFVFSQVSSYTEQKTDKLRIGVPRRATFKNFVEIKQSSENPNKKNYTGFCIELFKEIHEKLDDQIPYEFEEFDGSYDDLVANVANKTFGAAVGDITILADRWKEVDFSEPFTESGLSMIVPVKPSPKAWIFLYPFTLDMWLAIGVVLVYTMFVVWFVEHRSNPEFSGPWNDQLGSALWFTFCSLFLAHREKIQSNYARIVVVVWLFLGLVLTQSYTANLTSMLTISRLQPAIQSPSKHSKIGCDGNTFMEKYVKNVLNYKNVTLISDEDEYSRELENGTILAAFLEIPYAKVFLNKYCKKFSIIGTTYRFGGFGFIFHKGCRITRKVSKAILQLSENGTLKALEQKWLTPNNNECSKSQTTAENIDSLSFQNFWGLFVFSGATSSVCFLLFLVHLLRNYWHHQSSRVADHNSSDESISVKTFRVVRYLINAPKTMETSPNQAMPEIEMR